jgi:hypothetical protein
MFTVMVAKTATRIVGTSATTVKTPVRRRCSRDPAERARREARITRHLPQHKRRHHEDVDEIRQQHEPERGRDGGFGERTEDEKGRDREDRPEDHQPERGRAPAAFLAHLSESLDERWSRPVRRPVNHDASLLQHRWRRLRQDLSWPCLICHEPVACLHQLAAACHANIQIGDLFPQGIAVDAQKFGTFCLVAARRLEGDFDQRTFHFAQNPGVEAGRGQHPAMQVEIAAQVLGDGRQLVALSRPPSTARSRAASRAPPRPRRG